MSTGGTGTEQKLDTADLKRGGRILPRTAASAAGQLTIEPLQTGVASSYLIIDLSRSRTLHTLNLHLCMHETLYS